MIKTANSNLVLNTGTIIFDKNLDFSDTKYIGKIFEIKDAINLNNEKIDLPDNCTLFFNGGHLLNGILNLKSTLVKADSKNIFKNIGFSGFFANDCLNIKWFGAKGDGINHVNNSEDDNTNAIQIAINTTKPSGGTVFIPDGVFNLTKNVLLKSNITLKGNGSSTLVNLDTCHIDIGIYDNNNEINSLAQPSIYFRNEHIQRNNFSKGTITNDAMIGTNQLKVSSIEGLNIGDYLYISNGYCDMWTVMEDKEEAIRGADPDDEYPIVPNNHIWINEDVRLWESEMVQIKAVSNGLITLESPLSIEILAEPKKHSLFINESKENDYEGFNKPSFERLSGASNIYISNFHIAVKGLRTAAIRSILSFDCIIDKLNITGAADIETNLLEGTNNTKNYKSKGIELFSCKNFKIDKVDTIVNNYGISVRRGSEGILVTNVNCTHTGNKYDATVLLWENTYNSMVNGAILNSLNGNEKKIVRGGIYLNTCHSNIVSNVTAKNLQTVVYLGFSTGSGKCIINNINGLNCDRAVSTHSAFNASISNISITTRLTPTDDSKDLKDKYDEMGLKISASNSITVTNFTDNSIYNSNYDGIKNASNDKLSHEAKGRIHIWRSYNIIMNNIFSPNLILWDTKANDQKIVYDDFIQKRLICTYGEFHSVKSSYDYEENVHPVDTRRESEFKNLLIHNDLSLEFTKHALIDNCKILGKKNTGLDLYASPYTKIINSEIHGTDIAIDFQNSGNAGGVSSHIYVFNTIIESKGQKLKDYLDLTYTNSQNNLDKNHKQGQIISLLKDHPLTHEIVHVSDDKSWPINLKSTSIE